MVTHGPVPVREMEKNVILSVIVIQQTPTVPGLGLGPGVTSG